MTAYHLGILAENYRRMRNSAKGAVEAHYKAEQISLHVRAPLDVLIITGARYELARLYLARLRASEGL